MHRRARIFWLTISLGLLLPSLPALVRADAEPSVPGSVPVVTTRLSSVEWDELALARAVSAWIEGDLHAVVDLLRDVDVSTLSAFESADRAAFLLGEALLRMEDRAGFVQLSERAGDPKGSAYRRWIFDRAVVEKVRGEGSQANAPSMGREAGSASAKLLAANLLLEQGQAAAAAGSLASFGASDSQRALQLWLMALAQESSGADPTAALARLGQLKADGAGARELVAAALFRLATRRLEADLDPSEFLNRVPEGTRLWSRAQHILALRSLDAGIEADARQRVEAILDRDPSYEGRRDLHLLIGRLEIDARNWAAALFHFGAAESDLEDELGQLDGLRDPVVASRAWAAWRRGPDSARFDLSGEGLEIEARRQLELALDLRRAPERKITVELLANDPAAQSSGIAASLRLHRPDAQEWERWNRLDLEFRRAERELAATQHELRDEEIALARRERYLNRGESAALRSADELQAAVSRLDSMLVTLDAALAALQGIRDEELARIELRTRSMVESLRDDLLFMAAMRHFHVEGPQRKRLVTPPTGYPGAGSVLAAEDSLASELEQLVALFAARTPGVIEHSYSQIWEPRLTGDGYAVRDSLAFELERARAIAAALDSTALQLAQSPRRLELRARELALQALADSLSLDAERLRGEIAVAVATRGQTRLAREREALDYHLADAAFELAISRAMDPLTAEDPSVVVPARDAAIERLELFLSRHPESFARGESRFRLADLRLMKARDDFQSRMAGFLGENPDADELGNRALAPFVDYAPAETLYRAILDEDQDFPHLDAVLFSLGMILSDDGQAEATGQLTRLVRDYPDSEFRQEAYLRLGDDRFALKDYAGCTEYFEQAAAGADPSLSSIALYKLGWAHFEEDRFVPATDSFRRLMDLYGADVAVASDTDLREEAEEYLVHALARAGGARAFASYFDQLGPRDYEDEILLALTHLLRGFALYEDAADCDRLWLARYPQGEKALAVAQRLVDTHHRWNKTDEARRLQVELAPRFLEGSAWFAANASDSLRSEGAEFARAAYRTMALHHHHEAREKDDPASWRAALDNYAVYLRHWPEHGEAPRMHYHAGEVASRLRDFGLALEHFGVAAAADTASFQGDASWQRVAVSDAWYQSSLVERAGTKLGADSLATRVLDAGDAFLARYPQDERSADLLWRQGNLAYAHDWNARAAGAFDQLAARHPQDERVPVAARMQGDAFYREGSFGKAGVAYERAMGLAQSAGRDSLAHELAPIIPLSFYKEAEAVAAADTVQGETNAAPLFARVAERWPTFEHADLSLYRAGLGFAAGAQNADAVGAWEQLLSAHPKSAYARDSAVQVAQLYESGGNARSAASAYERFSSLFPEDPDAAEALLKSADLLASAGDARGAEETRTRFVQRFPGELDAVFEIRTERAAKELAKLGSDGAPLSSLITAGGVASAGSELAAYLELARAHPDKASPSILAQVDFMRAEESYPDYASIALTQPLPKSIEARKAKLEELLALYDRCSRRGIGEYTRASAHRIGQALIDFGQALRDSERPAGLEGDDLLAYEEVIEEQAFEFFDRGEQAWSELLRQGGSGVEDSGGWVARTRSLLWPRIAQRFVHRPEVEYPLVVAQPPAQPSE